MKKIIAMSLLLCLSLSLLGCQKSSEKEQTQTPKTNVENMENFNIEYNKSDFKGAPIKATANVQAMDTLMLLTVYAKDKDQAKKALSEGVQEIERIEKTLSTNVPSSELAKINKNGKGKFGDDGRYLMGRSQEIYTDTNGVFDVAIYPLVKAWGFTTNSFQVPNEATLQELLPICHLNLVDYNADTGEVVLTKKGMGLDFGGIAKGYTGDHLMKIFAKNGITSALVSLGGNVQLLNGKPNGDDFIVAIEDPKNPQGYIGSLAEKDRAIITSGAYQRFFEKDGVRYHHIIDPKTGAPSQSDLTSTTVITKDGTLGDAYSTTLYILGLEKAQDFWRKHADRFEMVLVDKNHKVYITEGLKDRYEPGEDFPAPTIIKKEG